MYKELDVVKFPQYKGISVNMMPVIFGQQDSLPKTMQGYFDLMQKCDFTPGEVVYLTVTESVVLQGETQRRGGLHTEGYKVSPKLQEKLVASGVNIETFACHGAGPQGGHGGGYSSWVPQPTPSIQYVPVPIPSGTPYRPVAPMPKVTPSKPEIEDWRRIPQRIVKLHAEGLYMASTDGACEIYDTQTFDVDEHGGLLSKPTVPAVRLNANQLYWCTDRTPHEPLPATHTAPRQFFRLVSGNLSVWYAQHNTSNPLGVQPTAPIVHFSKFDR